MPGRNSRGMKTATSERLIETTVKPICRAPSRLASSRFIPRSTWLSTFSIMTIASSTTKPTAMVSAISEILSMEKPKSHIATVAPTSERGTVTPAAMTGDARRRKR